MGDAAGAQTRGLRCRVFGTVHTLRVAVNPMSVPASLRSVQGPIVSDHSRHAFRSRLVVEATAAIIPAASLGWVSSSEAASRVHSERASGGAPTLRARRTRRLPANFGP